jgi:hypothetical protein
MMVNDSMIKIDRLMGLITPSGKINPKIMQAGQFSLASINANAQLNGTTAFPVAFDNIPGVLIGTNESFFGVSVAGKSKTSVSWTVLNNFGAALANRTAWWIAVDPNYILPMGGGVT